MVRILTFVSILALLAGSALGWFVAEARAGAGTGTAATPSIDPVVEGKVRLYEARYALDAGATQEIRSALSDYDQGLIDLLNQLRQKHRDAFKTLSDRANARIDAALRGLPR